jgi:dienelactone hydrolase
MSMNDTSRQPLKPLTTLAALVLLAAPIAAGPGKEDGKLKVETDTFKSGGKDITVECFAPSVPGKHLVVVALHAVDGIDAGCARLYRTAAKDYAGRGYVVLFVHYFDRTGAARKDVEGYRDLFVGHFQRKEHKVEDLKQMKALLEVWAEVLRDALAYTRGRPDVDGERIGLVGFSLGGTVALSATIQYDLKLAALAEFFAALPQELRPALKKLPPTLIIHGEQDPVVPVEQAYALIGLLSLRKLAHEAEVYPGVGHMFSLAGKETQWVPFLTAKRRTGAFLDKHLKPGAAPKKRTRLRLEHTVPTLGVGSRATTRIGARTLLASLVLKIIATAPGNGLAIKHVCIMLQVRVEPCCPYGRLRSTEALGPVLLHHILALPQALGYYKDSVAMGVTTVRRSLGCEDRFGLSVGPPFIRCHPHWVTVWPGSS